jgi:putative addiction module killer protein
VFEIVQTETFSTWLTGLRDRAAGARIAERLRRLSLGHVGDAKPVGDGVSELRIDHGPGYRVYFMRRGGVLMVLLCGGDKSSQARDIARAKALAKMVEP